VRCVRHLSDPPVDRGLPCLQLEGHLSCMICGPPSYVCPMALICCDACGCHSTVRYLIHKNDSAHSVCCRATFWTSSYPVSAAELAAGASAAPAAGAPAAILPLAAARQAPAMGASLEIGIDSAGDLRVVADPLLSETAVADAAAGRSSADVPAGVEAAGHAVAAAAAAVLVRGSGQDGTGGAEAHELRLDVASGDGGSPLLAAARATAALQLGMRLKSTPCPVLD